METDAFAPEMRREYRSPNILVEVMVKPQPRIALQCTACKKPALDHREAVRQGPAVLSEVR